MAVCGVTFSRSDLINLTKQHDTLVCVDSDGCVFDTMEVKQKQCFHPLIVAYWGLEPIEAYVRETAAFVNLYSRHRGRNRFLSLYDTFALLRSRPETAAAGVSLPRLTGLKRFIDTAAALDNEHLEREVAATGDIELRTVLAWSKAVNVRVRQKADRTLPFEWGLRALRQIAGASDMIVVSQTPEEALVHEWRQSGLFNLVRAIAGQELGTKYEHILMAMGDGRYREDQVLMIGDAPGDLDAAARAGVLFYPITPGHEETAWRRFGETGYDRFLGGTFAGEFQDRLIAEFLSALPKTPPWEQAA